QALTQWDAIAADSVVLISGASGGVGVASTQLALAMGHTVAGLSRSEKRRAELKKLGMHIALDPADKTWRKQLMDSIAPRKVSLVIDNVGGELFGELIATLGERGRVSVVGRLAGPVPQFNTASLFFRRLRIGGVAVGAYTPDECRMAWRQVLDLLSRTNAKPVIDRVFPFNQVPQSFERLAQGPMGKVVVKVN